MNNTSFHLIVLAAILSYASALEAEGTSEESDLASDIHNLSNRTVHSRRKRYIVFPQGSSLQLVYCFTYPFHPVVNIFRFGITTGLAWMLPSDADIFLDKKKHQKFRRHVYDNLEYSMEVVGGNGRQCTLRALCESGQRTPSKKPFITEILHRIFTIAEEEEDGETHLDKTYRKAHRSVNQDCEKLFPKCRYSLFKQSGVDSAS